VDSAGSRILTKTTPRPAPQAQGADSTLPKAVAEARPFLQGAAAATFSQAIVAANESAKDVFQGSALGMETRPNA
jgi:hypothetical protein